MSQKRRLIGNSVAMLLNRLTQGIATFVLSAAIARTLGAYALGQYLLAISYYYIFVSITSQGFKTLFTREIARNPAATPVYLVSGSLLQLLVSLVGYAAMLAIIYLLPYSTDTSILCYIIGFTAIPFGLSNITESIFQAQEQMHSIALATVPVYILRLLAMLWVMQVRHQIMDVGIILVISETLILAIEWLMLVKIVTPQWQIDRDFMVNIIKTAKTLFATEGLGMIAAKIDVLILSLLGSELLLGLYGSVMQLLQPYSIVSNSLNLAAFPRMSKAVDLGRDLQRQEAENTIVTLLCLGLPFSIGTLFYGQDLLLLIYQNQDFSQAVTVLNLMCISMMIATFSQTFSYVLIANGLEKFNLIEVVITTTIGGLSGIFFITKYQLMGAVFMSLMMTFSNFGVLGFAVHQRIFPLRILQILRLPLLMSGVMSIVYLSLQHLNLNFLLTLSLAVCAYVILVAVVMVRELGGLDRVRQSIVKFRS
jgi:O-antigen/teichoic acid export membrane protein